MILPAGAVSKSAKHILNTDKVIGIDGRKAMIDGARYWVLEDGFAPEETHDAR